MTNELSILLTGHSSLTDWRPWAMGPWGHEAMREWKTSANEAPAGIRWNCHPLFPTKWQLWNADRSKLITEETWRHLSPWRRFSLVFPSSFSFLNSHLPLITTLSPNLISPSIHNFSSNPPVFMCFSLPSSFSSAFRFESSWLRLLHGKCPSRRLLAMNFNANSSPKTRPWADHGPALFTSFPI